MGGSISSVRYWHGRLVEAQQKHGQHSTSPSSSRNNALPSGKPFVSHKMM